MTDSSTTLSASNAPLKAGVHARLRAETAPEHRATEDAFGGFKFSNDGGYAAFLTAQASAVAGVEDALRGADGLPSWNPRTPLIKEDLAELGLPMPAPVAFTLPATSAGQWGALYVLEGSRLGGVVLERSLPAGLPRRFLSAKHEGANWRNFLAALDSAADAGGTTWFDEAKAGALQAFAAFRTAAKSDQSHGR